MLAANIEGHPVYDVPEVRHALQEIANGKVKWDYAKALYDRFERKVWEKFGPQRR